jgi:hypothetical protein
MLDERNNKKVYDEMKKELRRDRAKSSVLPLTDFGLMQITRQRVRQAIGDTLSDTCPACGGTGMVVAKDTVMHQIERWLDRYSTESKREPLILRVHSTIYNDLSTGFISKLRKLGWKFKVKIKGRLDDELRADEFKFYRSSDNKDITNQYLGPRPDPVEEPIEKPKRREEGQRPEGRRNGPPRQGDRRGDGRREGPRRDGERREGRPESREGGEQREGGQNRNGRRPQRRRGNNNRRPPREGGQGQPQGMPRQQQMQQRPQM